MQINEDDEGDGDAQAPTEEENVSARRTKDPRDSSYRANDSIAFCMSSNRIYETGNASCTVTITGLVRIIAIAILFGKHDAT